MNVEVIIMQTFKPDFKRLRRKYRSLDGDMAHLIADLRKNPLQGISIGHGMRKMRLPISSKGRGKSGGARVISHVTIVAEVDGAIVRLLKIYDKAKRETISDAELHELLRKNGLL